MQSHSLSRNRVVVVEDEPDVGRLIELTLKRAGDFEVETVVTGAAALTVVSDSVPDLVILDLNLPVLDGMEVFRILRSRNPTSKIPIIILTARATETDRVRGLELGADDYVTKPFSPRELLARMRAVLRRVPGADDLGPEEIRAGTLALYPRRFQVEAQGRPIRLTPTEFNVLRTLAQSPGQVFTRAQLIESAFGYDFEGFERNVDVHITSLRRKLGPVEGRFIKTVYGLGYKLEVEAAASA